MTIEHSSRRTATLILTYYGPDVDDGSMSVDDIGPAIEGLLSSYAKVLKLQNEEMPRLKHIKLGKGSAELLFLLENAGTIVTVGKMIEMVVRLCKWLKGRQPQKAIPTLDQPEQSMILVSHSGEEITVPLDVFEAYRDKLLIPELRKMNAPLEEGRVEGWKTQAQDSQERIEYTVTDADKECFAEEKVTKTEETTLTGRLNAVTKSTQSGYILLSDGDRVHFKFVGDSPASLYKSFPHNGLVRVKCVARLNGSMKIIRLDISSIETLQGTFGFDATSQ